MEPEETQSHGIPRLNTLLTFGIRGTPKQWKRTRGTRIRFTPADYKAWKYLVADIAQQEIDVHNLTDKFPYKYPVTVGVEIHVPSLDHLIPFPDLDNILKGVCDALTGIVYPDDKPLHVRRKVISLEVRPQMQYVETFIAVATIKGLRSIFR